MDYNYVFAKPDEREGKEGGVLRGRGEVKEVWLFTWIYIMGCIKSVIFILGKKLKRKGLVMDNYNKSF